ncbi:MAG: HEAT repeat domain-containing protein [Methylacidiphilales bacterium]|nr:HEAT repeat domain-containing protein [Candidatus Methylacidiphilales bacterium]
MAIKLSLSGCICGTLVGMNQSVTGNMIANLIQKYPEQAPMVIAFTMENISKIFQRDEILNLFYAIANSNMNKDSYINIISRYIGRLGFLDDIYIYSIMIKFGHFEYIDHIFNIIEEHKKNRHLYSSFLSFVYEINLKEVAPLLLIKATHDPFYLTDYLIRTLINIGYSIETEWIVKVFNENNNSSECIQKSLLYALHDKHDEMAYEFLIKTYLSHASDDVRQAALKTLYKIKTTGALTEMMIRNFKLIGKDDLIDIKIMLQVNHKKAMALISDFIKNAPPDRIISLINIIISEDLDISSGLMKDIWRIQDPQVKLEVLKLINRQIKEENVGLIYEGIIHPNSLVRKMAVKSAVNYKDIRVENKLIEILNNLDELEEIRIAALEVLISKNDKRFNDIFIKALRYKKNLRKMALYGLNINEYALDLNELERMLLSVNDLEETILLFELTKNIDKEKAALFFNKIIGKPSQYHKFMFGLIYYINTFPDQAVEFIRKEIKSREKPDILYIEALLLSQNPTAIKLFMETMTLFNDEVYLKYIEYIKDDLLMNAVMNIVMNTNDLGEIRRILDFIYNKKPYLCEKLLINIKKEMVGEIKLSEIFGFLNNKITNERFVQ